MKRVVWVGVLAFFSPFIFFLVCLYLRRTFNKDQCGETRGGVAADVSSRKDSCRRVLNWNRRRSITGISMLMYIARTFFFSSIFVLFFALSELWGSNHVDPKCNCLPNLTSLKTTGVYSIPDHVGVFPQWSALKKKWNSLILASYSKTLLSCSKG